MSMKAFKYRLYANKATTAKLDEVLHRCRELYNAGLQERRDAYEMMVKRHPNYYDEESRKQLTRTHAIGYYEQKRELVDIKELRPEYQEIASHVLQDVILRLKRAFDRFFERIKNGQKPGYPRFQGHNRYTSFTYPDRAGWKLDERQHPPNKKEMVKVNLHLSKIGTVKLHLHRNIEGCIKTLTIKREGGDFYAVFTCEIGKTEPLPTSYEDVGIDLGVTHFASLSTGEFIDHPPLFSQGREKAGKGTTSSCKEEKGEPST